MISKHELNLFNLDKWLMGNENWLNIQPNYKQGRLLTKIFKTVDNQLQFNESFWEDIHIIN
jgi:hypothetical protein